MQKLVQQIFNYFSKLSRLTKVVLITVVILGMFGLLFQYLFPDRIPVVSKISPVFTVGVPEDSDFTISFSTILPESTQKKLKFVVEPEIAATRFWLENNYQYHFQITQLLKNKTNYKIKVLYKNKEIYSHEFITNEFSIEEQKEQIREQAQADLEFDQAIIKLKNDYPWYDDIPLETDQFTIIYNYDRKKFRIRLKIPEETDKEIVANLTKKALLTMEQKNIDPERWGGYYIAFIK